MRRWDSKGAARRRRVKNSPVNCFSAPRAGRDTAPVARANPARRSLKNCSGKQTNQPRTKCGAQVSSGVSGESRRIVADYTWFATILSKIISRPFRRSSFSAKSHACCGYSLVNALMTPALRYQLFSVRACGAGEYHNIFLVLAAWFVRPVVNALTAFRLLYQPFAGICGLHLVCLFILSQTSGNCKTKYLLLNCIWVFARNSHFDTVR